MEINRKSFFRIAGLTGLTLATGSKLQANQSVVNKTEFKGILYDAVRCEGCRGCEYDCADANELPEPLPNKQLKPGLRKPDENARTVVNTFETTKGKVSSKIQCMHCSEPACVSACLTQAMYKTPEGPVVWREDKCMGCRYCMISCPFDTPKFEFNKAVPKIQKCSMCFDTRVKNGEIPACAENCPNDALTFGLRHELIDEAHRRIVENPDLYYNGIYGEHEAGGTCWMYLSPVPFEEIGLNTQLQNESYPALTKGFLYSVPSVFILAPALLLGMQQATQSNDKSNTYDNEPE